MNKLPRFYNFLLNLFPKSYRSSYADEMSITLEDMLTNSASPRQRRSLLVHAYLELPLCIAHEYILIMEKNLIMDAPNYVRRNSLVAAALLIPFILALLANVIAQAMFHESLYGSWVWNYPVLLTWVLILPSVALIIATVSMIHFITTPKRTSPSWSSRLFTVKQYWPLLAVACVALTIVCIVRVHDAGGCWTHASPGISSYIHSSVTCTLRGQY
jgi:hypothetical protein